MRLILTIIPLVLFSIIGVQESFAENIFCKYASVPFNSEYEIVNGQVNALCLDKNALAIEIFIIPDGEGILTLTIPRNSIDIRNQDCTDKEFIITGDKQNLKFNELNATHDLRKLEIFFSEQGLNEYFVITTDVMIGKPYKLGSDCLEKSEEQSLKKQITNGISFKNIVCRDNLELIFKSSNNSPVCVKPQTAEKLIERGWGINDFNSIKPIDDFEDGDDDILDSDEYTKDQTWYLGEGLQKGDFFSYRFCQIDYQNCSDFDMDFWITNKTQTNSELQWLAEFVFYNKTKIVIGDVEFQELSAEPIGKNSDLADYLDVFNSSISWLSSFTTMIASEHFDQVPRSLNEGSKWKNLINVYNPEVHVVKSEIITITSGTYDSVLLQWSFDEKENKIWIVDEFPFPVKAEMWVRVNEDTPPQKLKFELLEQRENVSNPFQPIILLD